MNARLVRYRTEEGARPALVFEGRTKLHAVVIDSAGVRDLAVPREEERYMTPLAGSVHEAALAMKRAGRSLGISKAAARLLRGFVARKVAQ